MKANESESLIGAVVDINSRSVVKKFRPDIAWATAKGEEAGENGVMNEMMEEMISTDERPMSVAEVEACKDAAFEVSAGVDLGINPKTLKRLSPEIQAIYWEQVDLIRSLFDVTAANIGRIQELKRQSARPKSRGLHVVD